MKKRILASLMALCLLVGLLPTVALAAEDTFTVDGVKYSVIGESQVAVSGVTAEATSVTIPATVTNEEESYDVVRVSQMAFVAQNYAPNTTLTTITFAENSNVEEIGPAAFANCTALTSITLPDSEVSIGEAVFANCTSLNSVEIPANATLAPMVFGDHPYFGSDQFYGDGKITFAEGSPYQIADGILYNETSLLHVYDESVEVVNVPEGITTIDKIAFRQNKTLKSVTLPTTVTALESGAFQNCTSLESVILLGDIQKIGAVTFDGCTSLKTVKIPNSVAEIETNAFRNCSSLETVDFPESLEKIGQAAFSNCTSLKTANFPDGLTTIEKSAFSGCTALETVDLPDSLTTIGVGSFVKCTSLKEVEVPSGVSELPKNVFAGCLSLQSVTLHEGLTSIGENAFNLTSQGTNVNPQLESINIPSSVSNVGKNFLGGVKENGGTALIFEGTTPPNFATDALTGISGDGMNKPAVYYPAGAEDAYTAEGSALVEGNLVSKPAEGETPDNQYALSINEGTASVKVGKTVKLTVTSTIPTGAALEWSSSNAETATVSNGTITGVKAGSATITASIVKNGVTLVSDSCSVTVSEESSGGGSSDDDSEPTYNVALPSKVTGGEIKVSPRNAEKGETVTITVDPDKGYELDELMVTDRKGKELDLTDKGNGKYTFKMPASRVEVEVSFKQIDAEPEVPAFADVPADAYYADAVAWAVKEGITSGTSATTFTPNASCTRAQMVTFLWRANGSPVVNYAMTFTDVPADAYYAEAVRWAVSEGITTGTTATTFSPDATLTRAQAVTFIYRNVQAQGGGFTGSWMFPCPFTDVPADAYYFESVQWCAMKNITSGTSATTFSPDATCTRAQIVTFMYRAG